MDNVIYKYIHYSPLVPHGAPYNASLFNLSVDPGEGTDLLAMGGSVAAWALAKQMQVSLRLALDGQDPDAVDRRFKAQDWERFMQWAYQPPGSPHRRKYDDPKANPALTLTLIGGSTNSRWKACAGSAHGN